MKKSILLLSALCITLSSWAYDFKSGGIYYTITSSTTPYMIAVSSDNVSYSHYSGSITIPNSVIYNSINYSVTSIGNGAFSECSALTSITIPSTITSIGNGAFAFCSGLTSLSIPSSVTSIGEASFNGCSGLTSITIDPANTTFSSEDGVLFNKDKTMLFYCLNTKSGSYAIPSTVTSIIGGTFSGCSGLTSITIPTAVTSIIGGTFNGCSGLTSITIPSAVTSIGNYAFNGCSGLTSINIPSAVTSIGDGAFLGCSGLTSIYVNNATPVDLSFSYYVFANILGSYTSTCVLHVPFGSAAAYDAAVQWTDFTTIVADVTPVFNAKASNLKITTVNGKAVISGLSQGTSLAVYNLQGAVIYNQQAASETVCVNLSARGVYVVKVGTESVKVVY